jgi:hypothetical protein
MLIVLGLGFLIMLACPVVAIVHTRKVNQLQENNYQTTLERDYLRKQLSRYDRTEIAPFREQVPKKMPDSRPLPDPPRMRFAIPPIPPIPPMPPMPSMTHLPRAPVVNLSPLNRFFKQWVDDMRGMQRNNLDGSVSFTIPTTSVTNDLIDRVNDMGATMESESRYNRTKITMDERTFYARKLNL